jgi:hypothetical protein
MLSAIICCLCQAFCGVLIIKLLRFLDSVSGYAEIFIVTEKLFSREVALLVDRYDAKAWYAEDLTVKYQRNPASFFLKVRTLNS